MLPAMVVVPRPPSLKPFREYVELEAQNLINSSLSAVSADGALLEYETLELRVHPPNVEIDNETREDATIITVDSANRPGTLVEVVQSLTELGLHVGQARISSDRGWFVDDFYVTESDGRKVTSEAKMDSIRKILSVEHTFLPGTGPESTVLELAGEDSPELLANVVLLLAQAGFDVQSASVWTYKNRAAFVMSISQGKHTVVDFLRLEALRQVVLNMMGGHGKGVASVQKVHGDVHLEHRLHQLLLKQEMKRFGSNQETWAIATSVLPPPSPRTAASDSSWQLYRSPKHCYPTITIEPLSRLGYWVVKVECKDHNKLLFDLACTFADLDYDVYHGTVDIDGKTAFLEFYIRPRFYEVEWDDVRVGTLKYLLKAAIQRRFPRGLKVHVHLPTKSGYLMAFLQGLKQSMLRVTRAKVRVQADGKNLAHTFYIMAADGSTPCHSKVEAACSRFGGRISSVGESDSSSEDDGESGATLVKFGFSLFGKHQNQEWEMSSSSSSTSESF